MVWSPFGLSRVVTGVAVAGVVLLQPQPASAATASVTEPPGESRTVFYQAAAGEANNVTVTFAPGYGGLEITDTGATITVGSGCVSVTPQTARCSLKDFSDILDVELGDESDFVRLDTYGDQAFLRGGEGNDTIIGGDWLIEYLFGGPGNDILRGRNEADKLDGGPGADILRGGSSGFSHGGRFIVHGDRVIYGGRVRGVRADADGVADDGEPGEGDNIGADIESITGGSGNDVLTSGGEGHSLDGDAGDDVLVGLGGMDYLEGGAGDDTLHGGPGRDVLLGERGDDTLRGGRDGDFLLGAGGHDFLSGGKWADEIQGANGNDVIVGGFGRDSLWGGEGDDLLLARDGYEDTLAAGFGRDRARVDRLDRVRGVERRLP